MNNKNKIIILISIITGVLLVAFGLTYAAFTYNRTGETSELVLGDIYMKYTENNQLTLSDAMPTSFKLNTLELPSVNSYVVNPVMETQTIEETNELTNCVVYFSLLSFDEGSDAESYCKGEGTAKSSEMANSLTIQEGITEWKNWRGVSNFLSDGGQYLLDLGVIIQDGENYTVNPIMETQSVLDINELTTCTIIYSETTLEDGVSVVDFCQGNTSGVVTNVVASGEVDDIVSKTSTGQTLQGLINEKSSSETFLTKGGQYLLDLGIIKEAEFSTIKYNYTGLIVNPDMEGEVLESCKTLFTDLGFEFEDGKTVEDFCQGTGTSSGKTINDLATDTDFLKGDGHQLLRSGVVLAKIDLPYFEFKITGKNTYTKEDIWYDVVLTHGDNHETRTERIRDDLLRFTLTEVDSSGGETTIVNNMTLYDIKNGERLYVETIPKNTMEEINKTYRLYMNIAESTVICGGEVSDACDYYTDKSPNWNEVFASVKVNVTGDFNEKETTKYLSSFYRNYVLENETSTIKTDEDGTIYMAGVLQENASGEIDFDGERVDYNFVWYSGKLWRITAINPDGTLKMITEDVVTTISFGNDSNYENSYVREWLNQEFLPTLHNYQNLIKMDSIWNITRTSDYIPENLSNGKAIPKLEKTTTIIDPIGLLNTYEYVISYMNAPAVVGVGVDVCGYLNVGYSWWLLNSFDDKNVNFVRYYSGARVQSLSPTNFSGVRPVVNLLSSVKISGGTGSEADPYRIIGDKEDVQANTTLLNTRSSGEYVKIENDTIANRLFRIINAETIDGKLTTKLITNDYVKDTSDLDSDNDKTERLKMQYANSQVLWSEIDETDENYWKGYLNNTWLKELDPTFNQATGESNILAKGIYYLDFNNYYKSTVCKNVSSDVTIAECVNNGNMIENTWQGYVGLPRYGELFASQPKDYVFRNHEDIDATPGSPASFYIISSDSSNNYIIDYYSLSGTSIARAARPTINLKSEIVIKSGSGTEQDPFIVGVKS